MQLSGVESAIRELQGEVKKIQKREDIERRRAETTTSE